MILFKKYRAKILVEHLLMVLFKIILETTQIIGANPVWIGLVGIINEIRAHIRDYLNSVCQDFATS